MGNQAIIRETKLPRLSLHILDKLTRTVEYDEVLFLRWVKNRVGQNSFLVAHLDFLRVEIIHKVELDGNLLSWDLASSPTIDVILMRTLLQSCLMLTVVNPSNTETGKQFISGILSMYVKTEKSHKLVNHATIKNDELTIVELCNSFVGV